MNIYRNIDRCFIFSCSDGCNIGVIKDVFLWQVTLQDNFNVRLELSFHETIRVGPKLSLSKTSCQKAKSSWIKGVLEKSLLIL